MACGGRPGGVGNRCGGRDPLRVPHRNANATNEKGEKGEREREEREGENEQFERPKPDSRLRRSERTARAPSSSRPAIASAPSEAAKIQARLAEGLIAKPSVPATSWVSLGPTDAPKSFNYF